MVPKMIHNTTTLNIKTKILVLLRAKALTKELDSPTKRVSLRILNTLSSRRALRAKRDWVPTKNKERYLGTVERKSIMP
jgi:hypothetical protein